VERHNWAALSVSYMEKGRSWAVAWLPGPPRAAPRCRKRSAAESRPQILPGLVRDGDIGFQGIVVFVTGEGHFHRTNTKRTIDFDFSPK
jgi:hypothetical protein